jgi:hypothetical protein
MRARKGGEINTMTKGSECPYFSLQLSNQELELLAMVAVALVPTIIRNDVGKKLKNK